MVVMVLTMAEVCLPMSVLAFTSIPDMSHWNAHSSFSPTDTGEISQYNMPIALHISIHVPINALEWIIVSFCTQLKLHACYMTKLTYKTSIHVYSKIFLKNG